MTYKDACKESWKKVSDPDQSEIYSAIHALIRLKTIPVTSLLRKYRRNYHPAICLLAISELGWRGENLSAEEIKYMNLAMRGDEMDAIRAARGMASTDIKTTEDYLKSVVSNASDGFDAIEFSMNTWLELNSLNAIDWFDATGLKNDDPTDQIPLWSAIVEYRKDIKVLNSFRTYCLECSDNRLQHLTLRGLWRCYDNHAHVIAKQYCLNTPRHLANEGLIALGEVGQPNDIEWLVGYIEKQNINPLRYAAWGSILRISERYEIEFVENST